MKEKLWKLVVKRYKDKENIRRFIVEGISNIVFLIVALAIAYIIKLLY